MQVVSNKLVEITIFKLEVKSTFPFIGVERKGNKGNFLRVKYSKKNDVDNNYIFPNALVSNEELTEEQGEKYNDLMISFGSHTIHSLFDVIRKTNVKEHEQKRASRIANPQNNIDKTFNEFHSKALYRSMFLGYRKGSKDVEVNIIEDLTPVILAPILSETQNRVSLIVGDIGCGKSTVVTALYFKVVSHILNIDTSRPKSPVPSIICFISFEELPSVNPNTDYNEYLHSKVIPYITDQIKRQTILKGSSLSSLLKNAETKNMIIIFDGLDNAYHEFCKGQFYRKPKDLNSAFSFYQNFTTEIIDMFVASDYSQHKTHCIFTLRNDTYNIIRNPSNPNTHRSRVLDNIFSIYSVHTPTSTDIRNILKGRFALASAISDQYDRISTLAKNAIDDGFFEVKLFYGLSIQGLRYFIYIMQELSKGILDERYFSRLVLNESNLKLFFLSSGRTHYSQVNYGFTNIFLVNPDYAETNKLANSAEIDYIDHDLMNFGEYQEYWIKYLILEYIHNDTPDIPSLRELFSKVGSYERDLVDLVLMSLADVDHGRLIRPQFVAQGLRQISMNGLETTARGKIFVTDQVMFDFEYLALACEDMWIKMPMSVGSYFDDPIGVGFLSSDSPDSYSDNLFAFLMKKILDVTTFLLVLECGFESEKRRNKKLFDHLVERGVSSPNFSLIQEKCVGVIRERALELTVERRDIIECELLAVSDVKITASLRSKIMKDFKLKRF